ncbi:MAG: DUF3574 domain-containing protein [Proteobacteria bacterium]|nr:DUF3574 domain-containing protein [Pseudomonadota bacterium]
MKLARGLFAAAGLVVLSAPLVGCISVSNAPASIACPPGQEPRRTAQLFFGRNIGDKPGVSDADFRAFADKELTPRFPEGLTVLDGGGQWKGDENKMIREASKVVLIVLPKTRDAQARIEAVRDAYKMRFHQDSVLVITQAACVAF